MLGLAYTGLRIARRNVDPFIKITAAAATVWLVGQAGINVGNVLGLLPVTGKPLPMDSTGGTSLVITMIVLGLLANFALQEPSAAAARMVKPPSRVATLLGLGVVPITLVLAAVALTLVSRTPTQSTSAPGTTDPRSRAR